MFRGILVVLILAAAAAAALLWYVRPQEQLDLSYSELHVRDKLAGMVRSLKPETVLTEAEVGDLLKKALAAHPQLSPDVTVTGARFSLMEGQLTADVNLLVRGKVKVGARLRFDLRWQSPYLIAVHTGTEVRNTALPLEWVPIQPLQIALNGYLPKHVALSTVSFEGTGVRLRFTWR